MDARITTRPGATDTSGWLPSRRSSITAAAPSSLAGVDLVEDLELDVLGGQDPVLAEGAACDRIAVMGPGTATLIALVAASVGVAVWSLTSDHRAKRALRRVAHVRIADIRDGVRVKLIGTVKGAAAPLTSPNRREECVYYHAWYEELKRGIKGGVGWVSIGDEQHACDFVLEDESGVTASIDDDRLRRPRDRPTSAMLGG